MNYGLTNPNPSNIPPRTAPLGVRPLPKDDIRAMSQAAERKYELVFGKREAHKAHIKTKGPRYLTYLFTPFYVTQLFNWRNRTPDARVYFYTVDENLDAVLDGTLVIGDAIAALTSFRNGSMRIYMDSLDRG